jgi:hypothetical protein
VKRSAALLILLTFALSVAASTPEAEIPYFRNVRDVTVTAPDRQNYVIVDAAIWKHARPDLADLRLYDGSTQVPYQLTLQKAGTSAGEIEAKILNLIQKGDHTEFDLDVAPITEYNRIRLALDRKDFLITASVTGQNTLSAGNSTAWPNPSTLFDFSRENLGSNETITLPQWTFRYVHVRLSPGILPKDVKQATVAFVQERKAIWTDTGSCALVGAQKHTSVFMCNVPTAISIDRLEFDVPSTQVNFRRPVSVVNDKNVQVAAGSISRIRMNRGGTTALSEDLALNIFGDNTSRLIVTIDNGDDLPLSIDSVRPQSVQRRLYFEPQGKSGLKLYYGDDKLEAPVYDYAKFFHEDVNAVEAKIGWETANPSYAARPDDRPWSERHKGVLWLAMLLAVAILAVLALRGLKSGSSESQSRPTP